MSKITTLVEELVTPILDDLSLELIDMEYVKEGSNWFLRIFIDKDSGVDIEECGIVSERLSEKLDELDPIQHNYFLEVSSPGAERPLKKEKDFEKSIGKNVYVKLYEPMDGEKAFEGLLLSYTPEKLELELTIKTRKKKVEIPMDKVAAARLAVTFS
ncbi:MULTISPECIES: ribosome maturation factor RimP [Rossellomorea]|jgi:ribosome maturation factor RimP|uniref:Ribosome maturation factor RimP n=1 Tax=Rossellomorea marisflavi TaxID=189381 RepID=A0A0J5VDD9_9BACI|nr:ribosome maturation factor RimP [Rossellomorea marisflavi]KQU60337.1 ribosome maturation factor RimP [Bacillus sp. Leaf406]MBV6683288.1 ribosome maturation factor RimP [Bacillus sp. JRC01]VXC64952.1 ribosome maturation factor [Bacillus sp. 349Y]KMK96481.1 ribosome maturation factor RimP [Rossellomorea marisflavi]KML06478.1 ribosome maturation factor RimP [Rossellomorea marisflavi]